ncbi:CynX/NimT family MFS transporter [Actinomadura rupiterrae]|uniref:CynX/NimT family MFS transporter n=1 Tax=Actinomadura rupiterrae TaxID=559627 RepID=UPI0020A47017|nr:MFS transporter [Actinomadura rupiterrae]MCP2337259.1 CP family cyanate transporter-like MFS transporter [Actinomadura rupiterrae]
MTLREGSDPPSATRTEEISETPRATPAPETGSRWTVGVVGGLVLIVLVAVNLRPALTAVGPLVGEIRGDLHLSGTAAGALTTLPLMFLGSYGLLAAFLRRPLRPETLLVVAMVALTAAIGLRMIPFTGALFAGSLVAGMAISIGNIAVPGIIKRDHPRSITAVTALYTVALSGGAALGSGLSVPLEHATGGSWRVPLSLLVVPSVLAAVAWLPRMLRVRREAAGTAPAAAHRDVARKVWRSPLAWQITLFFGLQSSLAYVLFAWMPTLLADRGLSESSAGFVTAASSLIQIVGNMCLPLLTARLRDQRPIAVLVGVLTAAGFAGLTWAPLGGMWLFVAVLGLGQGASFALALSMIGLRSPDAATAAQLSGMVQGVGYLISALGPLLIGALHDATSGWTVPVALVVAIALLEIVPGLGAGRGRVLD